jgi:hypothetical protein
MILPTKHTSTKQSLLGVGAELLAALTRPRTVSSLWDDVRLSPTVGTFERFTMGLDLLYACGALVLSDGLLLRLER